MKKLICLIMITIMLLSATACLGSGKTRADINLYFKDSVTNELVVEKVKYTQSQNTVDMANFAVNMLSEGPSKNGHSKTLPENVTFSSVTVKDEIATVNFSREFTTFNGQDELIARFSVVRTLCDIPGISGVIIMVESMPLISNATGKEIGVLRTKDIVLDIDTDVDATTQTTTVTLYFSASDGMALKAEERKIETQNTISVEKAIINELLKGPVSPELVSVIPSGTKLLNIETRDNICYVNLSGDFVSKFSGGTGMLQVYSIVNSLCSLESVSGVQFLIEGEKGAEFGNYVFDEPFAMNSGIVEKK